MSELKYPVIVQPLSKEDGGGFLATVPDLPGCVSDGETPRKRLRMCRMPSQHGSKLPKIWEARCLSRQRNWRSRVSHLSALPQIA